MLCWMISSIGNTGLGEAKAFWISDSLTLLHTTDAALHGKSAEDGGIVEKRANFYADVFMSLVLKSKLVRIKYL